MKVTVIQWLGMTRKSIDEDVYIYRYVLQAENGIIEEDETEDMWIRPGTVLELPDDEWMPESEWYILKCDKCGYERRKKTVKGWTVTCPVCNHEEVIE